MTGTAETRAKEKRSKQNEDHESVSNQPNAPETILKPASQPPSIGKSHTTNQVGANGIESVSGFKPRSEMEVAPANLFTAPVTKEIRDIGEASFGKAAPILEIVHGPDDRVQITNTSIYPWRAIASLLITAADNSTWIGTGWFIGPHTLATAGHVVYIKNNGVPGRDGWVKNIQVMPGRNGTSLPFGSVTSTNFRTVNGWINSGSENYDYGVIITPTDLGSSVGWFGFGIYSDADLLTATGNISGYPGDKPSGTQWFDARRIASVNSQKVFYDIDSAGGQSGSAVFRIINNDRMAVAVHAYGGAVTNSGTRINQEVFNNLVAWKA